MSETFAWRAHGGSAPTLEFDRQLDCISLWIEAWDHSQRCALMEKIAMHSRNSQIVFLWTVLQPSLHRDFMYAAENAFPGVRFQPLSNHSSRKLKEKLIKTRKNDYHRLPSAYCVFPDEVKEKVKEKVQLPLVSPVKSSRSAPPSLTAAPSSRNADASLLPASSRQNMLFMDLCEPLSPLQRFVQQPVRRHIQQEHIRASGRGSHQQQAKSLFSLIKEQPPELTLLLDWYREHWTDMQRNEFLHKLLLKLDERQQFYLSNLLAVKQYKDFIGLLPEHISLKILSYLSAKELSVASRVCRSWQRLCENNALWQVKYKELVLPFPVRIDSPSNWKSFFRDVLFTTENWQKGRYKEQEIRGHHHGVLCIALDGDRMATGSSDHTIRLWSLKAVDCRGVLRGHNKGVWCLNFYLTDNLISGSYDATIKIWSIHNGKCLRTVLGHDGPVWSMCRKDDMLLTASQDKLVKVWDARRCSLKRQLIGHSAAVYAVALSEDGQHAFSGSADRSVRIWSVHLGFCKKVVWASGSGGSGESSAVMTVSFDAGYLACSHGETIAVYRLDDSCESVQLIATFEEHVKRIECLKLRIAVSPTPEGMVVSAGKDGTIKYWLLSQSKSLQTFKASKDSINCIAFNDTVIVVGTSDNKIKIYDFGPHVDDSCNSSKFSD